VSHFLSDCCLFFAMLLTPIYSRFCLERGHVVTTSATGIDTISPRPYDEFLWPENSEPLPIPDWNSFWKIWKRRCPHIRIRKVCEDTCPECYILKHKFRFSGNDNNNNNNNPPSANDEQDDDSLSLPSDVSSDREEYPYEQLIAEANQHAEEAQQQRALAKNRQQKAFDEANLPHDSRRFVFCSCHAAVSL
jgi:hypothetical protein